MLSCNLKCLNSIFITGKWIVLFPETMFYGRAINDDIPIPATLGAYVPDKDEWIIGVVDGPFLKMVRVSVTGPTSFDWIATKYDINYNKVCLSSFSESCFVGKSAKEKQYLVQLVAEPEGKSFIQFSICCL